MNTSEPSNISEDEERIFPGLLKLTEILERWNEREEQANLRMVRELEDMRRTLERLERELT